MRVLRSVCAVASVTAPAAALSTQRTLNLAEDVSVDSSTDALGHEERPAEERPAPLDIELLQQSATSSVSRAKPVKATVCNGFPHAKPVNVALGVRRYAGKDGKSLLQKLAKKTSANKISASRTSKKIKPTIPNTKSVAKHGNYENYEQEDHPDKESHHRQSAWDSLDYGDCRQYKVRNNQVFFFHFPPFVLEDDATHVYSPGPEGKIHVSPLGAIDPLMRGASKTLSYGNKESDDGNQGSFFPIRPRRTKRRSNTTLVFPKEPKDFFRNRPVVVLAGDASVVTLQLPEVERPTKTQLVIKYCC
jgi:hypothetical protein